MNVKPIKTKKEYQAALKALEEVFDSPANSKEGDKAELLAILIEDYENKHYAIDPPDPIEAIKIRMEELSLLQKDMVGIIGEKGKVSEILNKKRKLNLAMVRKIHKRLNISPEVLIKDYKLQP
ncbi:MAG: transcriptional regulator [Cyclobacteriaceae bacterium]|nr:transcriptional regulator [Cyclobacteriaceae bacterium]HRJ29064.1 transcriptional regulator [Cyclobacteriaceae bacterium]HRJ82148.1 transcriptional regulator [Cyclobacteriaceae bacterium]